jgi:sec-independent protein translocase protein TatC
LSEDDARMTFTEHLGELRTRLIRSAIAMVVAMVLCYIFANQLLEFMASPLGGLEGQGWTYLSPLEPVLVNLKLAAYGGFLLSSPYIVYQVCAFIFPGLKPKERRAAQIMLAGSSVLTLAGLAIAYFGVLPVVMPYLREWAPKTVPVQLRVTETIAIIGKGLAAFAISFQFPMVVLILVYMGLLTPEALKKGRAIAIVGMAVGSAALTPPDPFSMVVMLLPLILLYEGSILLSYLVVRRKKKDSSGAAE